MRVTLCTFAEDAPWGSAAGPFDRLADQCRFRLPLIVYRRALAACALSRATSITAPNTTEDASEIPNGKSLDPLNPPGGVLRRSQTAPIIANTESPKRTAAAMAMLCLRPLTKGPNLLLGTRSLDLKRVAHVEIIPTTKTIPRNPKKNGTLP